MNMQAIILAAGRGSRLDTVSNGVPKCLLDIGGRPLIDHHLEAFADAGVGPVVVVLGYRAEEVRAVVGNRALCAVNAQWEKTNSLYSFWTARDWVRGPVVVVNGDLLFHPEILERVIEIPNSAMAFDSKSGEGGEQMKVALQDARVVDIGKSLLKEHIAGENVGLIHLDASGTRRLFDQAEALIRSGHERGWLAEAVRTVAAEHAIRGVDVAGLPWAEIDFPYDLDRARKEVWPAIHRSRWRRTLRWRKTRWAALALASLALLGTGLYLGSPAVDWDTAGLTGGEKVNLVIDAAPQKWWMLNEGQVGQTEVEGPDSVRIEFRALLPQDAAEEMPFMVEIALDARPVKWHAFHAEPDAAATLRAGIAVGDRERIEMKLPPGTHVLRIRQMAGATKGCLVRVRQPQRVE